MRFLGGSWCAVSFSGLHRICVAFNGFWYMDHELCHIDKCKRYIARHCHYHAVTPFFVQDSLHRKTIPSWHVRFPLCFHNPSTIFLIIVQHFASLSSFLLFFKWCFIISCSWWFVMFHGNTRWTDPSAELSGQASPMGLSGQEHSGKYVGPVRETPGGYKMGAY